MSTSWDLSANYTRKFLLFNKVLLYGVATYITSDPHIDTTSIPKWGKPGLNPLISNLWLYDVWRCQYAKKRIIYILSPRHNTYSRIDLFLLDQWTLQKVSSSSILPATWLDHSPICITIEDNPKTSPTFLWKINTSILQSKLFSEWKIRKKYHANLIKTIINKKAAAKICEIHTKQWVQMEKKKLCKYTII